LVERRNGKQEEITTPQEFKPVRNLNAYNYFLEYLFPDAILYGMSYDEFWNKDPQLFFSYRFSYMEKLKETEYKENYIAWLNGVYNYQAFQTVLFNAFKGKEEQPQSYLSKPIDFYSKPETPVSKEKKEVKKKNGWARLKERSVK
jgi:hypothetical protein